MCSLLKKSEIIETKSGYNFPPTYIFIAKFPLHVCHAMEHMESKQWRGRSRPELPHDDGGDLRRYAPELEARAVDDVPPDVVAQDVRLVRAAGLSTVIQKAQRFGFRKVNAGLFPLCRKEKLSLIEQEIKPRVVRL